MSLIVDYFNFEMEISKYFIMDKVLLIFIWQYFDQLFMCNINSLNLQINQDQSFLNQHYRPGFLYCVKGIHLAMKNICSTKNLDFDTDDHYFEI